MGKRPEIWIKPLPDWRLMTEDRWSTLAKQKQAGIDGGQQAPCEGPVRAALPTDKFACCARQPQLTVPEDGAAWNLMDALVSAAGQVVVLMAGMLTRMVRDWPASTPLQCLALVGARPADHHRCPGGGSTRWLERLPTWFPGESNAGVERSLAGETVRASPSASAGATTPCL